MYYDAELSAAEAFCDRVEESCKQAAAARLAHQRPSETDEAIPAATPPLSDDFCPEGLW